MKSMKIRGNVAKRKKNHEKDKKKVFNIYCTLQVFSERMKLHKEASNKEFCTHCIYIAVVEYFTEAGLFVTPNSKSSLGFCNIYVETPT